MCSGGGGTGKLAWPIMAEQCRLSTAAHCAQISALFGPPSAPFATHAQPAGTEMAAPLKRFTMPPVVQATMEGHGHRHLCGTQEEGGGWGDVEVAFSADEGLADRKSVV